MAEPGLPKKAMDDPFRPPESSRRPAESRPESPAPEELLAQYDTVNEEPYFTRDGDDKVFSLEEAGRWFEDGDPDEKPGAEDDMPGLDAEDLWDDFELAPEEIESEEELMLCRQRQFRMAAEAVADAMGLRPEVEKVALFGSVAKPLEIEVPRFRKFRRERIEIPHECKDVDLAVWVSGVGGLRTLQKARSRALNDLLADRNIGVAHHQVDVFLLEHGTDRYLGRLCSFGQCPKGRNECRVPECGKTRFLRQHEGFRFDWTGASQGSIVLYEKNGDK